MPEDEHVAVGERCDALEGARRLVLEEVLVDREPADLAVVGGDVGAAAVVQLAGDRVVVVPVDGRDRPLLESAHTSFGRGP